MGDSSGEPSPETNHVETASSAAILLEERIRTLADIASVERKRFMELFEQTRGVLYGLVGGLQNEISSKVRQVENDVFVMQQQMQADLNTMQQHITEKVGQAEEELEVRTVPSNVTIL